MQQSSLIPSIAFADWRALPFGDFRPGIRAHWLVKGGELEPSVAVLAYEPGASVPRHRHQALETIVVLAGVQSDEKGDYGPGTVILNPAGTEHSVWTDAGCVVLVQWNLPVIFVGGEP